MKKLLNVKSFTLMELMAVVIILGIIAAFAIPQYQNTIARAHRRDAEMNLLAIQAAQELFRARNNTYWPNGGSCTVTPPPPAACNNRDINQINSNLGLGIVENDLAFFCQSTATTFFCGAYYPNDNASVSGQWGLGIGNGTATFCFHPTCP